MLTNEQKSTILNSSVKASGMKVPFATQRFPMIDGVQQKVTLIASVSDTFYNIGFAAGVENTINGNIADKLLTEYPNVFKLYKLNGRLVDAGAKESKESKLKSEIIAQLKEDFDFVPKKDSKPTNRSRTSEPKSKK